MVGVFSNGGFSLKLFSCNKEITIFVTEVILNKVKSNCFCSGISYLYNAKISKIWATCIKLWRATSDTGASQMPYVSGFTIAGHINSVNIKSIAIAFACKGSV